MPTNSKNELINELWANTDPLTINEASALWINESPHLLSLDPDDAKHTTETHHNKRNLEKIRLELCLAVSRYWNKDEGKLKISEAQTLKPTSFFPSYDTDEDGRPTGQTNEAYPAPDRTTVSRENLARWAMDNKHNPSFLKEEIDDLLPFKDRHPETPPYLNPEHEHYSIALAVAVEAWLHLFDENNLKDGSSPKSQLAGHIRKQKIKGFTSTRIDDIASIANPQQKGGCPKSS